MCDTPVKLKTGDVVPCGLCSDCLASHRNGWIRRLNAEANASVHSYFITLTYHDENLTFADSDTPVLNYRDVQLFFKKARKSGQKFKYFGCGEYGEHYGRPHYHCLIFYNDLKYDITKLVSHWKLGFTDIQFLTEGNLKYTTKDMLKERELFQDVPRPLKPHIFCSKGIGIDFVKQNEQFYRDNPYEIPKMAFEGKGVSLPRYFKEKIFSDYERNIHRRRYEIIRRYTLSHNKNLCREEIKDLEREAKLHVQKVEAKKRKRLKINHFNRKL